MIRNLKTLGLALVAVFAMSAVASSMASAKDLGSHAGLFTAGVAAGVQAKIDSEQIAAGGDTFQLVESGLKLTCGTVSAQGTAITAGPSSTYVKLTPTYHNCHVVVAGLTKTVTVTHNECQYTFNATTTTTESTPSGLSFDRTVDLHITCPANKHIEIHVYKEKAAELNTECTYTITPQTILNIPVTNIIGSPNDVVADINSQVQVENDILNAVCGQKANTTATYVGQDTIRATDGAGNFVNASVSD
jgi:hypothetical protein